MTGVLGQWIKEDFAGSPIRLIPRERRVQDFEGRRKRFRGLVQEDRGSGDGWFATLGGSAVIRFVNAR